MAQELSNCDMCGTNTIVERKYFHYPIKCLCCNNADDSHFEIVRYCANCEPKAPRKVTCEIKSE